MNHAHAVRSLLNTKTIFRKLSGRLIIFLLRLLSRFSYSQITYLGNFLGKLFYYLPLRSKHTVQTNLSYCFPQMPQKEREVLVKKILQESTKTLLEYAIIGHWTNEQIRALIQEIHGQDLLIDAIENNKGVILFSPHLGNWEMIGFFASRFAPTTSLYAVGKIPLLDQFIFQARTKNGSHLVPTDQQGIRALMKALKANELIILLPDQVPDKNSGVFAPFFGPLALTMTLLSNLVRRTGATALCCYTKRRDDMKGFDVIITLADDKLAAEDDLIAATALNRSIQQCIDTCFSQYQWGYKRFKRPALDEKKIYD
jgi:Kdo2-lipid IVA lauroyltransferase/acyltransferase